MDMLQIMQERHSVRAYLDKPIEGEALAALRQEVADCNRESGLHFQLVTDEPEAFQAGKPSYGSFKGCKNYLALVGTKGRDEAVGYYGERIVLRAQALGINSCWVALTYKKGKAKTDVRDGEKCYMVIALGYGATQGAAHKSKTPAQVSDVTDDAPEWYKNGVNAALLAPTAMNQQKFRFTRQGDSVLAKAGMGFYTKVDLGIAKYHFELGSGKDKSVWL